MNRILFSFTLSLAVFAGARGAAAADDFISMILPETYSDSAQALLAGARRAADEHNFELRAITLSPERDQDSQAAFLKNVIAEKPSAIVITTSSYPALWSVLPDVDRSVGVFGIGPSVYEEARFPSVMTNNLGVGEIAADVIGDRRGSEEGDIAFIASGTAGRWVDDRVAGFIAQMKQYPRLKIVAQDHSVDVPSAVELVEKVIASYPNLKGIFAATEEATIAAGLAAEKYKGAVTVVGFGATAETQKMLDNGVISGLVVPNTFKIGYEFVSLAVASKAGQQAQSTTTVDANLIVTSRRFLEHHDYPPVATAAYGIVALTQLPTPEDKKRVDAVCNAYVATFPYSTNIQAPVGQQMVTVWPVDDHRTLLKMEQTKDATGVCDLAVQHYDLPTSLTAIKEAESTARNTRLDGVGPYLLAWAPSSTKGKKDTLVLVRDLSGATKEAAFEDYFREWRDSIEKDPSVWSNGFSLEMSWTPDLGPLAKV